MCVDLTVHSNPGQLDKPSSRTGSNTLLLATVESVRLILVVAKLKPDLRKKGALMLTRRMLTATTLVVTVMSGYVFSQEKEETEEPKGGKAVILSPPGYCAIALTGRAGSNYLYFCRTYLGGNPCTGASSYQWTSPAVAVPEACPCGNNLRASDDITASRFHRKLSADIDDLKSSLPATHPRRREGNVNPRAALRTTATERVYIVHEGVNRFFLMTQFKLNLSNRLAEYPPGSSDPAERADQHLGLESEAPESGTMGLTRLDLETGIAPDGRSTVIWRGVETTVFLAPDENVE
jgi:hypothetical protein